MTLDEAIKHAEEVAKKQENNAKNYPRPDRSVKGSGKKYNAYLKCAEEHRQLAEWLKELKQLKEQVSNSEKPNRWIPVSERLPEAFRFVNCTCHSLIDDREDWVVETVYIPQPVGSPYSDWGNIVMLNNGDCEVIAWMYRDIPEPYKASPTGAESEVQDADSD